jgi:DNA-binding Lrp family transcriptional regulator
MAAIDHALAVDQDAVAPSRSTSSPCHITLATHSPDNAKRFRALVNRVDDIQEAYSLTGDADYLLKAVQRDLKGLSDIVNNVLMPHHSVAHVRSSIVLDRLKEHARLPLKTLR